jgi:hypothetical protein
MNVPGGALIWPAYVNAASELWDTGRHDEAEHVLMSALAQAEELRLLDGDLVESVHELAGWYCANGRYNRAERLYRCVLRVRERVLGPGHIDMADSLERVASVLRENGRPVEGAALEAQARGILVSHGSMSSQ